MLISCLTDAVLWDEDWKDSESLLDADPKSGRAVKEMLGIDDDYYSAQGKMAVISAGFRKGDKSMPIEVRKTTFAGIT